ncbi:MAG: RHS repeat-associated core domain-containing protein, partial [Gemmatimonadales bacterium]
LMYMRNRYYDPATGRFTQEDPIGLAGGLNLYGFANGDPINFSDPFGLCADDNGDDDGKECDPGTAKWYADRIANGEGNRLLNEVGGTLATCGESLACNAVLLVGGTVGTAAARLGGALETAATATGNVSVGVGSSTEARIAGRLWTLSRGERLIRAERGTGKIIGRISGDATRVYRAPQLKTTGPNAGRRAANLMRKLFGGKQVANTHVVIP